jgi:hypothetical protein
MKKPAEAGFFASCSKTAGGFSEHPEKHQQQDNGDGDTE